MAALAPGILQKLIDGMDTGAQKPFGEHRSALLQVTDIVPADLDEKDLWPKHGFYVKVADLSHSLYATLPMDQDDLVLSNKLQLGQFIYVDRLEPASPVPVIMGAKPLPGRQPIVGRQEPIVRQKSLSKIAMASSAHKRRSWEQNPVACVPSSKTVKSILLDFGEKTPMRSRTQNLVLSPPTSRTPGKAGSCQKIIRSSVRRALSKMTNSMEVSSAASVRKSCSVSRISRCSTVSKHDLKIENNPIATSKSVSCTPLANFRSAALDEEDLLSCLSDEQSSSTTVDSSDYQSPAKHSSGERLILPGKLNTLGKEALENRDAAQKVALQALRDASATETVIRVVKVFSELSSNAKPEAPAACFEQFLGFHQQIVQAILEIEAIQAATSITAVGEGSIKNNDPSILHERNGNSCNQSTPKITKRRAAAISKSASFALDTDDFKLSLCMHPRTSSRNHKYAEDGCIINEDKAAVSTLGNSLNLAKKIRVESGKWFMEFLEAALESSLKKSGFCPQSLTLRVVNWIELELCEGKKPLHPRAAQIARKLRIKAKNPCSG